MQGFHKETLMKNKNCKNCGKLLAKHMKVTCSHNCAGKLGRNGRPTKRHRITNGYKEIYHPDHKRKNKYIREHILVVSKHIGRDVAYPENIHHIDGDKLNNKIGNLYLCKNVSEHTKIHHSMELVVQELYKKGFVKFNDGKYEAVANLYLEIKKGV